LTKLTAKFLLIKISKNP